jgi:SAM-dependent methyltransferase
MNYDEYYDADNLSLPEFITARLDEIVVGFAPYRQSNRLLEVGFGAGSVMEAAARGGWEVSGVEVSRSAVEHARGRGFEVFNGELANANYPEGHFDVVVASEILEHIPEPQKLISEVYRVLRPGGLLWATTPNSRSVSSRVLGAKWSAIGPPEHLHLFSRQGMKRMLGAAGFKYVRVNTEGLNPSEIMNHLRRSKPAPTTDEIPPSHQRVAAAYELNAAMQASPLRRSVKGAANSVLRATFLGDSLKVWAER